jgi:hypothetical protein
MKHLLCLLPLVALVLHSGCKSIGPATVARDRFDYSIAVTESWKRQTLLNIVKMRYIDPPIFVDVGQIVAGYQLETAVSLTGQVYAGTGNDYLNGNVNGRFTDRPTITYTPLTGAKFVNALVSPIPPASIFQAIQSGWPADAMLKLSVASINGLRNDDSARKSTTPPDPRFSRLLELLRKTQDGGSMNIRLRVNETKQVSTLVTLPALNAPEADHSDAMEIRELLGLSKEANEFQLVPGTHAANDQEIAVQTRSLMGVITALSRHVDVPPDHTAAGLAFPGQETTQGFKIRSSPSEPKGAFVSVKYREHWFWIEDNDLGSKLYFAYIMLLFTMAETSSTQPMPILTIPTG